MELSGEEIKKTTSKDKKTDLSEIYKEQIIHFLLPKCQKLSNEGKYNELLKYFDRFLDLSSTPSYWWFAKGFCFYKLEEYEKALECYEKALTFDPLMKAAMAGKWFTLSRMEQNRERSDDDLKRIWSAKGDFLANLSKNVIRDGFCDSLEIDHEEKIPSMNIGNCYLYLKKYEKAIFHYNKSLEYDVEKTFAWNNKGIALYKLKKFKESMFCIEKILTELDPYPFQTLTLKGFLLRDIIMINFPIAFPVFLEMII